MPQLYLNNFQTQFIADVRAAPQTGAPASELDYGVLRVSDGAAGTLLNPAAGGWYVLTAYKRSGSLETDYEILRVTAVDNSVIGECRLTVLRGQEGTVPRAYIAGDLLEVRMTAGGMREVVQTTDARMSNPRAPAGAAGGVLGGQFPNPTFAQPMALASDLTGKVDKVAGKGLSANDFTDEAVSKLGGVVAGATKNASDAQLRDRGTHIGRQAIETISGLREALDSPFAWVDIEDKPTTLMGMGITDALGVAGIFDSTVLMRNAPLNKSSSFRAEATSGADWPTANFPVWWNVMTIGVETQKTQIAQQVFNGGYDTNIVYSRSKSDDVWSAWRPMGKKPVRFVTEPLGYMYGELPQDGMNTINVISHAGACFKYMPANPLPGDECTFFIANGRTDNGLAVDAIEGSQRPIMGLNEAIYIDRINHPVTFVYINPILGWRLI